MNEVVEVVGMLSKFLVRLLSFLPVQGISMFVETQLNKHFKFSEHVL